ncbi:C39 family peptidase, partial [Ligilactobacillus agilis]|uniref:C39 family peptidase n=1 Tax=Ligilactobacillus agilis TaxID=1601 RepID=UPI00195EEF1F
GQQNISGHWYLFDGVTGAMKTGLQWIGSQNKTVYYAGNGQMQYGQKNLAGHWYYFNPGTGAMATGITYLPDQHKTVYYAANGQMQYGQQQINGAWYYFEEGSGAMVRGLKAIPSQGKIVYYGNDGKMKYGTFREGRITYYADNVSGAIHGVYNDAQVIAQRPELPTGCEITAVTMMLRYAGVNVSKTQLADEMPRSSNPDYGFIGNPYSIYGNWVAPGGVAPVINRHLGHSQIMTGASLQAIKDKLLLENHLVVVWFANINGFGTHTVTLTGYNNDTIYYNNPWTARKESMSLGTFYYHWNKDAQRAISY